MNSISISYAYISLFNHELLLAKYLPSFNREFQNKIFSYRRWQDAQLSLLGRLLLEKALADRAILFKEENIYYNSFYKPFYKDAEIEFNISHSGSIVVCAVTKKIELGIDIEMMEDITFDDFRSQMLDIEWAQIQNAKNGKSSFFDYWTKKEAVLKAMGTGLSSSLKSFEIIDNKTTINGDVFYLTEIFLDKDYKCHLACRGIEDITILPPESNVFTV